MSLLSKLVHHLEAGRLKVVDLTQPLGPATPVIGLPPQFGSSPGVTMEVISRFDEKGPAWYWNIIRMGEHTGTHFDAPIHWITGKNLPDNSCDTIPPGRFVGPACVIDVTAEVAKNPDFLLLPEHILAWEKQHGRIPARAWVLLRTGWSRRTDPAAFLNVGADGPPSPGVHRSAAGLPGRGRAGLGGGRGPGGWGRGSWPSPPPRQPAGRGGEKPRPPSPGCPPPPAPAGPPLPRAP